MLWQGVVWQLRYRFRRRREDRLPSQEAARSIGQVDSSGMSPGSSRKGPVADPVRNIEVFISAHSWFVRNAQIHGPIWSVLTLASAFRFNRDNTIPVDIKAGVAHEVSC
jgi:hypothetical protein